MGVNGCGIGYPVLNFRALLWTKSYCSLLFAALSLYEQADVIRPASRAESQALALRRWVREANGIECRTYFDLGEDVSLA